MLRPLHVVEDDAQDTDTASEATVLDFSTGRPVGDSDDPDSTDAA